jgi:hypothetical protein
MKRKKRKKGKSWVKGVLITLVLIGIGIALLSLFRQEISRFVRPWIEKRGFIEGKREATLYFSDQEAEYLIGEKKRDQEEGRG